ncbi:MAG: hypothetical protein OYM47_20945 [Gemmatimonadota bacterium]|nr:hypothetical protein [Gemmatimonadota bacterium]
MTAEIAILNRQAVAMAADSAATSFPGGSQKISSYANKLFALSNFAPVGILIHGNANFITIPWETIIKEYRNFLGNRTYEVLEGYAEDFCSFVSSTISEHIDEKEQLAYALHLIEGVFNEIKSIAHQRLSKEQGKIEDIIVEIIDFYHSRAKSASLNENRPKCFESRLKCKIGKDIKLRCREIFDSCSISEEYINKLDYIAIKVIDCRTEEIITNTVNHTSGIAIAGFGMNDIFPVIQQFTTDGLIFDKITVYEKETERFGLAAGALMVPFAQSDMVNLFMEGVAREYGSFLAETMYTHLQENISNVIRLIGPHIDEDTDTDKLVKEMMGQLPTVVDSFMSELNGLSKTKFSDPIMNVVATLPKEQLAEMAEALVSLTALKRRVSDQEETVGGPIDVAIITKGDGLIWIKRKHYFSPELNPSYFARNHARRF